MLLVELLPDSLLLPGGVEHEDPRLAEDVGALGRWSSTHRDPEARQRGVDLAASGGRPEAGCASARCRRAEWGGVAGEMETETRTLFDVMWS